MRRSVLVVLAVFSLAVSLIGLAPDAGAAKPVRDPIDQPVGSSPPTKQAEAIGRGGAVSSVDPYATAVGIKVLRRGGNAADAAIATAAALGVTEPYSAGIGGGGFLVYYDARTGKVSTIDGRETAPASFTPEVFIDQGDGQAPRLHQMSSIPACPSGSPAPRPCGRPPGNGSAAGA